MEGLNICISIKSCLWVPVIPVFMWNEKFGSSGKKFANLR